MKNRKRGFLLTECLIGITVLSLLAAFILPAFHNMWRNVVRADREVSLLFHSQNLAEDLMALYHVKSSPAPSLTYHALDLNEVSVLLTSARTGDRIEKVFKAHGKDLYWKLDIIEKNTSGILCRSVLRDDPMSEGFTLDFMLSSLGG